MKILSVICIIRKKEKITINKSLLYNSIVSIIINIFRRCRFHISQIF
jgi:ABC-type methionine transport system permease subunit